ncbi:MAG: aminopeptidase P N-terminal domain-containing protein [Firmicutes bacterium]|nr:aminopeptidase P N-terminal domain-containing protein [Bacillota bacterium]
MTVQYFAERRARLIDALPDNSLAVFFSGEELIASRDTGLPYWVSRNFYYLTGLDRERMVLIVSKRDGQGQSRLWIERPEPDREKWTGYRMRKEAATAASGIEDISFTEDFTAALPRLLQGIEHLYADLDRLTWEGPKTREETFVSDLRERFLSLQIHNVGGLLADLRLIKSPDEVDSLRKAIAITWDGIERMLKASRSGLMEYQLEAEFNYALMQQGVRQMGYPSIVASGANAVVLHYNTNAAKTQDGDLVLLDLGAQYNHYSADISFTFPVNGKFTERQRAFYEIVWQALTETAAQVRPGATWQELNDCTKRILSDGLKRLGVIQDDSELSQYFYHGVGHFLGLDVHDVGGRDIALAPGMVVTIEPGLYIAQEGIGIRLEDDVLVTESGFEVLSQQIVRDPAAIEAIMRK